jgi:hypothetical protein
MQSVETKSIPCTNTKPDRIKVSAWCGSKIYSVPKEADGMTQAHTIVALRFFEEKDWLGGKAYQVVRGGRADTSGFNFCIINDNDLINVGGVK